MKSFSRKKHLQSFRNEDYPTAVTTAGSCEYEVEKCDENVCTLRLDFEEFTLDSWAATASDDSGYICSDTFVVSDVSKILTRYLIFFKKKILF